MKNLNFDIKKISIFLLTFLYCILCATAKGKDYTIVIDAGHGGHDHGAIDNGTREKDINLGVALKLGELIKKNLKDINVVYTRNNDTFVSLQGRADIANKAKGNLFISIHTNSLDKSNKNRANVSGSSVYALGLHKDANNMNVARRENSVITLEDDYNSTYQGFNPDRDESYIIFEMAQKKNLSKSIKFANDVQKQLVKESNRKDRGVHQAGFWVLWATSMPAVLIELDFICNPTSATFLASESGQQKLARSIFNAVKNYYQTENAAIKYTPSAQQKQREIEAEKKRKEIKKTHKVSTSEEGKKDDMEKPEGSDISPVVITSTGSEVKREHVKKSDKFTTARRRRSENGKKESCANTVTATEIPLKHELDLIPKQVDDRSAIQNNTDSYKAQKKIDTKRHSKSSKKDKKHSRVQHLKTIYSIQILASVDKLKQNNPRFAGLSPINIIKENNLYKYSYGESESLEEIEALLKKVRKDFPDAFIIEYKKNKQQ